MHEALPAWRMQELQRQFRRLTKLMASKDGSPIDPDYVAWALQALLNREELTSNQSAPPSKPGEVITAPKLTVEALLKLIESESGVETVRRDALSIGLQLYKSSDTWGDHAKFETVFWKPGPVDDLDTLDVFSYFVERGCESDLGLFLEWRRGSKLAGNFVMALYPDGRGHVSADFRIGKRKTLAFFRHTDLNSENMVFVAFKELPKA